MSTTFTEALRLLKDENLVWSDEFEEIRRPLADLLVRIEQSGSHQFDDLVDELVKAIAEPELSVPEPLERWVIDSARTLGVYQAVAGRSKQTADAVRKLFGIL